MRLWRRPKEFRPRIQVDANALGAANRMVLGHNAEWHHFTEYPNVWDGPRLTPGLIQAIKDMGTTSLRYPGGCHADYHEWESGIGPYSQRPKALNPFKNVEMDLRLGTDELLELCYQTEAVPWLQTNPMTGSQRVLEWARYCTSRGATVFYWELGNETYLADPKDTSPTNPNNAQIAMNAADYSQRVDEQLRAIRAEIPEAVVGAIGGVKPEAGFWLDTYFALDWNETVLREIGNEIDFLAIHTAYAPLAFTEDLDDPDVLRRAFIASGAWPQAFRRNLNANFDLIDEYVTERELPVAVTEWLPWFGIAGTSPYLSGAAGSIPYTAGMLNCFLREPRVMAAHWMAFLQPAFGGAITLRPDGWTPSVHHAVFSLYNRFLGSERLACQVTADTYACEAIGVVPEQSHVPSIDAIATKDVEGKVTVFVVNRDLEQGRTVELDVEALEMTVNGTWTVTGDWLDTNGPAAGPLSLREDPIVIQDGPKVESTDEEMWIDLPSCSVTAIQFTER